jgi:hypothetical protein
MPQRALTACLIVVAALADSAGAHGVAFYALVAAVPCGAAAALTSFGSVLDERDDAIAAMQALLWALCLLLVLAGCASRASSLQTPSLPTFAASTLSAALVVLAVKGSLAGWVLVRSRLGRALEPRATRA